MVVCYSWPTSLIILIHCKHNVTLRLVFMSSSIFPTVPTNNGIEFWLGNGSPDASLRVAGR